MPLDINTIRAYKGGDPEKVRESQRRRFADVALVDKVIAEDEEWRRLVALADDKRGEKNAKQKEITALKKAKKDVDPQLLKDHCNLRHQKDYKHLILYDSFIT